MSPSLGWRKTALSSKPNLASSANRSSSMVITAEDDLLALDAKFGFDDNAVFRHPKLGDMRDYDEEDPNEVEASQHDLSYISLTGNIGCLVNGAGLAMATMDIIKHYGGDPANFLDVGGGATIERVTEAFKIILSDRNE